MGHQRLNLAQLLYNGGGGLPDQHPAKERQRLCVVAVRLNGVKDVIVGETMATARVKVIFTVGRRRVHDTGTGTVLDVFRQQDGRRAVIKGVLEADMIQGTALGARDHGAGLFKTRQTRLVEGLSQQQHALARVDKHIHKIGMNGERLVSRDGPRGCGPDDDRGPLWQRVKAKGRRQRGTVLVEDVKRHINGI